MAFHQLPLSPALTARTRPHLCTHLCIQTLPPSPECGGAGPSRLKRLFTRSFKDRVSSFLAFRDLDTTEATGTPAVTPTRQGSARRQAVSPCTRSACSAFVSPYYARRASQERDSRPSQHPSKHRPHQEAPLPPRRRHFVARPRPPPPLRWRPRAWLSPPNPPVREAKRSRSAPRFSSSVTTLRQDLGCRRANRNEQQQSRQSWEVERGRLCAA